MKKIIFLLGIICGSFQIMYAQKTLSGVITNDMGEKLIGASVFWQNNMSLGVYTDTAGRFEIPRPDTSANLVVNYVGYNPVTFLIEPFEETLELEISGIIVLDDVEVRARNTDNFTSTLSTRNLESINSKELTKAACCSLGESFETNGSVDVNYTDALTGAREIQMLGLRGIYTQLLLEKRPIYTGLATPFALDYLPGTFLSSIQISKGVSSVQSGMGGIAGQINLEAQKPWDDKPLFVNLYGSTTSRFEANIHLNKKLNETNGIGVYLHGDIQNHEMDTDDNGFMDMPLKKQLNGLVRYMNMGEIVRGQINFQGISERRASGQISHHGAHTGRLYSIEQNVDRMEVFGKLAYLGFGAPHQSLALIYSATLHQLESLYGDTRHTGTQKSVYGTLLFNTNIGDPDHKLNITATYQMDDFEEYLNETDWSRTDIVTGLAGEYAWNYVNNSGGYWWTSAGIVAGLRADYHSRFDLLVSPQLVGRFNFSDETVVRASVGRAYRTPNVIAENIRFLPSSRTMLLVENPEVEEAWNYGINFTTNFKLWGKFAGFSLDAYRTDFQNQVVLDMESDADNILIYNLDGQSYSNSLLGTFTLELTEGLDMKLAYKINDVKVTFANELLQKPLIPKHRGLVTLDYETPSEKWMFNVSTQIIGSQRMPENSFIPDNLGEFPRTTPAYALLNAQVTFRQNKMFEWYVGGENLTGYQQENPIIGFEDPFGGYFDATRVYAPLFGARAYLGLRFSIQ
ncbi:MAG: TonB-dependent receptor [Saprospiraceae bacterium]